VGLVQSISLYKPCYVISGEGNWFAYIYSVDGIKSWTGTRFLDSEDDTTQILEFFLLLMKNKLWIVDKAYLNM
jgi:hypothetical protein